MTGSDYKRFSSMAYHGSELEDFARTGKLQGQVLYGLTQDLLIQRLFNMIEQNHPICAKTPEDAMASAELLGTASTHGLIENYLAEKELNPSLKISQSNWMPIYLNQLSDNPVLPQLGFDISAVRRVMPSLVQASFDEAKQVIQAMIKERPRQETQGVA